MDIRAESESFDAAYHIEARSRLGGGSAYAVVWTAGRPGHDFEGLAEDVPCRKVTSTALRVLEGIRAVPKGSFATQEILNVAADSLVAAGRLGIFTPMYYHKARKLD